MPHTQAQKNKRVRQKWYVAVLIFHMSSPPEDEKKTFVRHELRLIRAADDEAAYERALFLGRAEENSGWQFAGIHDLVWLLDLPRGSAMVKKVSPRDGVCLFH